MRTDAQSRIMSLSFRREPKEHAEVMLEAGRRLTMSRSSAYGWLLLLGAVAFGAAVGLVMEGYRRFILSPLFGIDDVAPLGVIILQLLPFFLLLFVLLFTYARYARKRRKQALIDRLAPDQFVDTDIFTDGFTTSAGPVTLSVDWVAVADVIVGDRRIEFVSDSFVAYIPERAFPDRRAFAAAGSQLYQLWQDAKRKQKEAADDPAALGGAARPPIS
jgi:hypothetical protein